MSHLTGHMYHTMPAIRPSRNNHPLPLSPPETDQESFHTQVPAASLIAGAELDQLVHSTSTLPERSKIQYRKTSALAYQSSSVRDIRDRALSRGSKNLIVVLPPPEFPLDHGHLGNVLSMGPRHRLSQGILMPLCPTMYGQLTAIAREFNFPSTVGLCLYHHITENGITMTPRISDDAWHYLWGHLFESRSPNGSQQLPISGRVEFDIDLKKARWFDAWLAGTLRDETVVPAPLSHASMHHWPEDSRSMFAEEHVMHEDRWDNQTTRSNSRSTTLRHVPRKLSLVDRLDSAALQASYKASSPPPHHIAHHLSPIPQSAVPQPSKAELHQRVTSWRANSLLDPASMAESYQPVTDVAPGGEVVTPVDDYPLEGETEAEVQEPLNLADFAWSITSAGPLSPPLDSPMSPYRLPSVHLDRRMEESVLLTPSTATSWGPADDDWLTDVSSIDRLPSPDIGGRMIESAPLTPATATSWGPADDWRSDVSSIDRLPSPDIAYRVLEDAPVNEVSGGPWSRFEVGNVSSSVKSYSPWAGMCASSSSWFNVRNVSPSVNSYSPWTGMSAPSSSWFDVANAATVPSTTSYNPWSGMRNQVWPWFDIHASRDTEAQPKSSTSVNPWAGMPCFNMGAWHDVNGAQPRSSVVVSLSRSGGLEPTYPSLDIYPPAYPYFDIYPALADGVGQSSGPSSAGGYPVLDIYPAVYPHFNLYPSISCSIISSPEKLTLKSVNVKLIPAYPLFNLYPALYPYNLNSVYPAAAASVNLSLSVLLSSSYPWLSIYSPVYPHVIPYPQASDKVTRFGEAKDGVMAPVRVKLLPQYPVLIIYSAVYPWNLDTIYPRTKVEEALSSSVLLQSSYPWITIYPSVYPHVILYPQACARVTRPGDSNEVVAPVQVKLSSQYPVLDIYPAVYPWNLDTIYPLTEVKGNLSSVVLLRSSYPWLTIYPPVYPHVNPYPQASAEVTRPGEVKDEVAALVRVKLSSQYPVLDIYPAVYPWNMETIYPSTKVERTPEIIVCLPSRYPWLDIYPSVYPFVEPYSTVSGTCESPGSKSPAELDCIKVNLDRYYPAFDLYPAAYPHFDIYPALPDISSRCLQLEQRIECAKITTDDVSVDLAGNYPYIRPYSPAYPHFDLYPHVQTHAAPDGKNLTKGKVLVSSSAYPYLVIYPPAYPYFDLYPVRAAEPTILKESKTHNITASSYPYLVVYPPVYPYFNLYPSIPPRIAAPAASGESAVRVDHGYPFLNIYPAGYPFFDIYPALCSVARPFQRAIGVPDARLLSPVARKRPAKTKLHQQLHDEVFIEAVDPNILRITAPIPSGSAVGILHGYPVLNIYHDVYPYFDIYPALHSVPQPLQTAIDKFDAELQAEVAPSSMARKCPAKTKTHCQLHDEVFVKGVVWTPSGYVQDLALPNKPHEEHSRGPRRRQPSVQEVGPRLVRSRSGTLAKQQTQSSPSLRASPPLPNAPPIPPLRISSPGVPAVAELPKHTSQAPPASPTSRLSQAVRSIGSSLIPGMQGRNLPLTSDNHNEQATSLTRSMSSSFDRRISMIPPLSPHDPSHLIRSQSSVHQAAQSLVLQRARAYEQSTTHSRHQSYNTRGTPFSLPSLRSVPDLPQGPKTDRSNHTLLQNYTP